MCTRRTSLSKCEHSHKLLIKIFIQLKSLQSMNGYLGIVVVVCVCVSKPNTMAFTIMKYAWFFFSMCFWFRLEILEAFDRKRDPFEYNTLWINRAEYGNIIACLIRLAHIMLFFFLLCIRFCSLRLWKWPSSLIMITLRNDYLNRITVASIGNHFTHSLTVVLFSSLV